jgi:hypothetical protein
MPTEHQEQADARAKILRELHDLLREVCNHVVGSSDNAYAARYDDPLGSVDRVRQLESAGEQIYLAERGLLLDIAHRVSGREVANVKEALRVFFTDEALDMLLKVKAPQLFWGLAATCALNCAWGGRDNPMPMPLRVVQLAFWFKRHNVRRWLKPNKKLRGALKEKGLAGLSTEEVVWLTTYDAICLEIGPEGELQIRLNGFFPTVESLLDDDEVFEE